MEDILNDQPYFLDLDGVVVNFADSVCQLFNRPDLIGNHEWDMHEPLGITDAELWKKINEQGPEWWERLPEYPWANELISMLGDNFYIVSSPSTSLPAMLGKIKYIQNRFGQSFKNFVLTRQKYLLAGNGLLIDDSDENVDLFRQNGGQAILFPRCWNRNRALQHVPLEYTRAILQEGYVG